MKLTKEGKTWCGIYVAISCFSNIGHGTLTTVLGPTQVYLAKNIGVDIDTINLVWTIGFIGFFIGAFGTGMVFKQFVRSPMGKVLYLQHSNNCLLSLLVSFNASFRSPMLAEFLQSAVS